jgi:hypothetical protein
LPNPDSDRPLHDNPSAGALASPRSSALSALANELISNAF